MRYSSNLAARVLGFASLFCVLLAGNPTPMLAQNSQQTLTGWLSIAYGDPQRGSNLPPQVRVSLTDGSGNILALLNIDPVEAQALVGQRVSVTGPLSVQGAASGENVTRLDVQSVQSFAASIPLRPQMLSGSQPWVSVLCKFSDVAAEPFTPTRNLALFGSSYPGLDDYFRKMSYDNINLNGTAISSHWYKLPHTRSFYVSGGANLDKLAADCAGVANAEFFYPNYVGINFMFNDVLDCCAWGGETDLTLDGQTRTYRTTWLPPWAQEHDVLAHEMGHGFGFPHSTGPASRPPNGLNVYVSQWDVMSDSGGTCAVRTTNNKCLPPGTIAYHLDLDGWIPQNRRVVVLPNRKATVTLEQLQNPGANNNALIVRIPINGSSTLFYTVEARTRTGYDQNIPGDAVIIHLVNAARSFQNGQAMVVDADTNNNVNDAGAMWLPGETFTDLARNISVEVLSSTATSFTVRVWNNIQVDPPNAAPRLNFSADGDYTMTWNRVEWAVTYDVQVSTTASFVPLFDSASNLPNDVLSFSVDDIPDGLYYWRVRAKTSGGTPGAWSSAQSFEVSRPEDD